LPALSPNAGGSERNVWQVGIAYRSLVLNSAYQAGVIVLLMLSGIAGGTAGFGLRNRGVGSNPSRRAS